MTLSSSWLSNLTPNYGSQPMLQSIWCYFWRWHKMLILLAECKCAQDEHCVATLPRFMQCIGPAIQGTLSFCLSFCWYINFILYIIVYHCWFYFKPHRALFVIVYILPGIWSVLLKMVNLLYGTHIQLTRYVFFELIGFCLGFLVFLSNASIHL